MPHNGQIYKSMFQKSKLEKQEEQLDTPVVGTSDTITLTKEELETLMDDVDKGIGWSDTSYRICRFIGIDPTDGV